MANRLAEYFDLPEADVQNALTYWTQSKGIDFNRVGGAVRPDLSHHRAYGSVHGGSIA